MPSADLDAYEVGDVLGVGTVGTIYAATKRESGERFAIKKLHPSVSLDPLIRARFRREMSVLERLHHPNIISFFGGGEDDGQLFYVMELVEGGTVKDLLRDAVADSYGRWLSKLPARSARHFNTRTTTE